MANYKKPKEKTFIISRSQKPTFPKVQLCVHRLYQEKLHGEVSPVVRVNLVKQRKQPPLRTKHKFLNFGSWFA